MRRRDRIEDSPSPLEPDRTALLRGPFGAGQKRGSGESITVRGLAQVQMGVGQDSGGRAAPAQAARSAFFTDTDMDVTAGLVVGT